MFLDNLNPQTMVELATESIRRAIVTGAFEPGAKLTEVQLAQELNVSRGPVRAALQALSLEGLIRTVPHTGYFVSNFSASDIKEIYSLRWAIERLALQTVTEEPARLPSLLESLKAITEGMRSHMEDDSWAAIAKDDLEFHKCIVERARHKRALLVYQNLQSQMELVLNLQQGLFKEPGDVVEDHLALIEFLGTRPTFAKVEGRFHRHIEESLDYLIRHSADEVEAQGKGRREQA